MVIRRMVSLLVRFAVIAGPGLLMGQVPADRPGEKVVFVRSNDDVASGGVIFTPSKEAAKPVAVVWIPGWGTNFYSPTYVNIGRALAARGLTTISGNTRMHDVGNVLGYRKGKRVRGGGYWGVTSEASRDIAAWIDFAQGAGFDKVIVVGHSAGWSSVARYQADAQDKRVVGLEVASGAIGQVSVGENPELKEQAKRLINEGNGEELIRLPNRSFPSFVSAATYLDSVNTPEEYLDFFGTKISNPAVMRVRCPILAFFGSVDDVGGEEHLKSLTSAVGRLSSGPSKVDTTMIKGGDHMYAGQEEQVARVIAEWAERVLMKKP